MDATSTEPPSDPGISGGDAESGGPPMPVGDILEHEAEAGLRELDRPGRGLLLSGLSAGLDIAFGPALMAVLATLAAGESELLRRLLVANAYSVGFIFVVLGRSELFTEHTTMAVVPVLQRRASVGALARLWSLVYASNLVGATASGAIVAVVLTSLGVASNEAVTELGRHVVDHSWWVILVSGVLAGWLMGLLTWLSRTTRAAISQMAMVWMVTATIGIAELHHCIAGTVEVVMAIVTSAGAVGFGDLGRFLLFATLGNAIGGVIFVALVKLGHARRPSRRE